MRQSNTVGIGGGDCDICSIALATWGLLSFLYEFYNCFFSSVKKCVEMCW